MSNWRSIDPSFEGGQERKEASRAAATAFIYIYSKPVRASEKRYGARATFANRSANFSRTPNNIMAFTLHTRRKTSRLCYTLMYEESFRKRGLIKKYDLIVSLSSSRIPPLSLSFLLPLLHFHLPFSRLISPVALNQTPRLAWNNHDKGR